MGRKAVVERIDHLVLRRNQRRSTVGFVVGACVYAVLSVAAAATGGIELAVLGAVFSGSLAVAALWRSSRRDEISVAEGKLEVTRHVGPICFGRDRVAPSELRVIDHEARPDAMFAVVAMTGPGYLELRSAGGLPVPIARGLGYDGAMLHALMARVQLLLSPTIS